MKSETGFTLVEVMIALVILSVSILGFLALTSATIQTNLENDARNASIRLTNQTAEMLLAEPVDTLVTCGLHAEPADLAGVANNQAPFYNVNYTYGNTNTCLAGGGALYTRYPNPVQTIRGTRQYSYNVTWTVTNQTADLKEADITVKYIYNNRVVTNQAVVYVHRTL